ncbi:MAG: hypothetical protein OXE74_02450 [Cyanobacteria bacterium MAG CAR2_bin_4]|nr:hypothetical protein [Cyanobacteria bacterium MAG CAR2_bin_4]
MDPDLTAYLEKAREKASADLEKALAAGDFEAVGKALRRLKNVEEAIKAAGGNIDLGKYEKAKAAAAQNRKKFNDLYLTLRGIFPFFKDVWKRKYGKVAIIGVGVCAVLLIANSNNTVQDGIISKPTPERAKDLIRPIDHPHYPDAPDKWEADAVGFGIAEKGIYRNVKCEDTEDPAECRLRYLKYDLDHGIVVNWLDYCQGKIGENIPARNVCYKIHADWFRTPKYPRDTTLKEMLKDLYDII